MAGPWGWRRCVCPVFTFLGHDSSAWAYPGDVVGQRRRRRRSTWLLEEVDERPGGRFWRGLEGLGLIGTRPHRHSSYSRSQQQREALADSSGVLSLLVCVCPFWCWC